MPQSLQEFVSNEQNVSKWMSLPPTEQGKFLQHYSEFSGLPPTEQTKFIEKLRTSKGTPLFGSMPERAAAGVGRAIKGVLYDTPKGVFHAAVDQSGTHISDRPDTKRGVGTTLSRTLLDPSYAMKQKAEQAADQGQTWKTLAYSAAEFPLIGPTVAGVVEGFASGDVAGTVSEFGTLALLPKLVKNLPAEFMSKYRPKVVEVEGTKFLVPVSEAAESPASSKAAIKQASFKSSGVGAEEWDKINRYNQSAAREVIRNVAKKTAGMSGPIAEGAGAATKQAGDYVLDEARPMYKALDAAMQGSPTLRVIVQDMSQVVEAAMKKAEKYGAPPMSKGSTAPGLKTPPLETYLQARSALKDIAYKTSDPIVRRGVGQALDEMDAGIEKAMKGSGVPGMYDNFTEANRLWAKGKAIQRVSESLDRATSGVPSGRQNASLAARPPKLQSGKLANELRDLDKSGDLNRAFGKQGADALFKVADLLDRQTPAKLLPGELKLWHDLKSMATGPYRKYMVRVMTSPQGARTVIDLAKSYLPTRIKDYSLELNRAVQQGAQAQSPPPSDSSVTN